MSEGTGIIQRLDTAHGGHRDALDRVPATLQQEPHQMARRMLQKCGNELHRVTELPENIEAA